RRQSSQVRHDVSQNEPAMRRIGPLLVLVLSALACACAPPQPAPERVASIVYLRALQNDDGGVRAAAAAGPSQLGSTVPCLRGLKYFGGAPRDPAAAERFVAGCFDAASGTFADHGSPPDVRSTAMGIMALVELKTPLAKYLPPAAAYFEK